jgi:DNA-binding SARP family transcriptional activator
VRQQACAILLGTYGEHGLTMLRRCLSAPDRGLRQQARLALQRIGELTDLPVNTQPFQGIYIECLGRMRLYVDSQEIRLDTWVRQVNEQVGWQKLQGVLGYLLHCGKRGTTRAALETAVWGSGRAATLGRTLQALRELLAALRGAEFAEYALTLADSHCLLNPDAFHTDVKAFEQAFALAVHTNETEGLEGAAPLCVQALRLYGGPYMIDLPQGAPWAQQRRDFLRSSFLIAAECVAEYTFEQGRYDDCVAVCSQIFDSDESADEVVAWLLRAYKQLGQTALLEQTYRRYVRANGLSEQSHDERQDVVIRAYKELRSTRLY